MEGIINWLKANKVIVGILSLALVVILGLGGALLGKPQASAPPLELPTVMTEESQIEFTATAPNYADVKGAVVKPGMYQIEDNMRVFDVVNLAGGFTAEADQKQVNFSQLVTDQMVIYVPEIGESSEWTEGQVATRLDSASDSLAPAKVNLNTADGKTLQQLNGIGEKKALAIIAYREEKGSFKSIEDLKKVSGIGDKTFEALKELIEV